MPLLNSPEWGLASGEEAERRRGLKQPGGEEHPERLGSGECWSTNQALCNSESCPRGAVFCQATSHLPPRLGMGLMSLSLGCASFSIKSLKLLRSPKKVLASDFCLASRFSRVSVAQERRI